MASPPIATTRLRQICTDACDAALSTAAVYEHSLTQKWNNDIINNILRSLISESSTGDEPSQYKFVVNTTIIQHLSDPKSVGEESVSLGGDKDKKVGRRGMHSASGAFWNNEKDGMWSYKYGGGEGKGMDIVKCIRADEQKEDAHRHDSRVRFADEVEQR